MNKQIILKALDHIDGAAALVSAITNAEEVENLDQACLLINTRLVREGALGPLFLFL